MFPAATLFLDVCVQRDLWLAGRWPLVDLRAGQNVARLLAIAASTEVRRGGVLCRHDAQGGAPAAPGVPTHGTTPESWLEPVGFQLRDSASIFVESGCGQPLDDPSHCAAFQRLTAGVRDAVVFGAGLEYGVAFAVEALLRRRIRTHLVIDAAVPADEVVAQLLIARWKRRGVDVVTVDVAERLLSVH